MRGASTMRKSIEEEIADRVAPLVVDAVTTALEEMVAASCESVESNSPETSWRVLLWSVPSETRMNKTELLEALDRSPAWLYARTSKERRREERIPCRRDKGSNELVFLAGEIREWVRSREIIVHPGRLAKKELAKDLSTGTG